MSHNGDKSELNVNDLIYNHFYETNNVSPS